MKKLHLTIIIAVFAVSIIVPIVGFLYNFSTHEISADPTAWGVFGDYLGGVLNPMLSLWSIIILGYLTFLVSKQSSEENKNLFMLQRKMLAYEDLTKHFNEINYITKAFAQLTNSIELLSKLPSSQIGGMLVQEIFKFQKVLSAFSEFHMTLFTFKVKYGLLFNYDFDSAEFKDLVDEAKRLGDEYDRLYKVLCSFDARDRDSLDLKISDKFLELGVKFINQLRAEIK